MDGYSNTDVADEDGYIWETIRLINPNRNTGDVAIRNAKKTIDYLLESARNWARSQLEPTPVWLYWQSEEEQPKRALVVDGSCEILGTEFDSPLLGNFGLDLALAVKRYKYWETEAAYTTTTTMGEGEKLVVGLAEGTTSQRIAKLEFSSENGQPIEKAWIGIRPTYRGTTGFISIWAATAGFQSTDTTIVADSLALSGSCSQVSFSGYATLEDRVNIEWQDISSGNYDDLAGRYLVLARMRVDASTTQVYAQLRAGLYSAGPVLGGAYLDGMHFGASWRYYEMGEVQIPLQGDRNQIGSIRDTLKQFMLSIYAERLSAAGSLKIDYLMLIPCEHLVTFDDDQTNNVPTLFAYTDEDGRQYGFGEDGAEYLKSISASFHSWEYPMNGGFVVFAAQEQPVHGLGRDYTVTLTTYPRWISYRTT